MHIEPPPEPCSTPSRASSGARIPLSTSGSDVTERILALSENLDEARPALEELRELVCGQLPR